MTKSERAKIKDAIRLIHEEDNGYEQGITILCRLVGFHYPAGELKDMRQVNVSDLAGEDRPFSAPA